VINAGHYVGITTPNETFEPLMGRKPNLMMDIHTVSGVNSVDLDQINGPATGATFNGNPNSVGTNITDVKQGQGRNLAGTDSTNAETH
jgi:NADH-quinone oxidoreductase subunit G